MSPWIISSVQLGLLPFFAEVALTFNDCCDYELCLSVSHCSLAGSAKNGLANFPSHRFRAHFSDPHPQKLCSGSNFDQKLGVWYLESQYFSIILSKKGAKIPPYVCIFVFLVLIQY